MSALLHNLDRLILRIETNLGLPSKGLKARKQLYQKRLEIRNQQWEQFLVNPDSKLVAPPEVPPPTFKTNTEFEEIFSQADLRVAQIVECWNHPSSDYLFCEKVDAGEGQLRSIATGLQRSLPLSEMSGLCVIFANLKPRKMGGYESNGMVMAVNKDGEYEIVRPPPGSEVGERVVLYGREGGKQPYLAKLNPKRKIMEKTIEQLGTDSSGIACFDGVPLQTSAGIIQCRLAGGSIS